jgi:hypothetical protein
MTSFPPNYYPAKMSLTVEEVLHEKLENCRELNRLIEYYEVLPQNQRIEFEYQVKLSDKDPVELWNLVKDFHNSNINSFNDEGKVQAFKRDEPELFATHQQNLVSIKAKEDKLLKAQQSRKNLLENSRLFLATTSSGIVIGGVISAIAMLAFGFLLQSGGGLMVRLTSRMSSPQKM